ncbi:MAG TPA: cytochrome c [Stellaceae bacterium]|jgi:methanol metabolism-related c-type cytochrome|nr:cytochrome c [Stellaceae bacterium]
MNLRNTLAVSLSVALGSLLGMSPVLAAESNQSAQKPYTIENGKVDKKTYNGWRRYTESCMRCHGPDGAGSSYAPDLVDSAKHMTQDQFNEIVVNGKTDVNTASQNVMPAFGTVKDVMDYLDDIWAYLKARADGVVGRGRPPRIGD